MGFGADPPGSGISETGDPSTGTFARIAGPLGKVPSSPLGWASWISAAATAFYIFWSIPTPWGSFFAIALPLLVLRLPITGIIAIAIVAQEVSSTGHRGFLNTLGNNVYVGPAKIPIIVPLAVIAVLAATSRSPRLDLKRIRLGHIALFGPIAGLILLTFAVGIFGGQSVPSAVNQNSRPFILLLLGLVIGISVRRGRAGIKLLTITVGAALTALIAAAAVAVPLGGTANAHVSKYFIYYDWSLPAIAAAVLIALLGDRAWRWNWQYMIIAASLPLLILVSFRRAVWIAAAVVLAVASILAWRRWKQTFSRMAFAAVIAAVVVAGAPGFAADLALRSGVSDESSNNAEAAKTPAPTPSTPSPTLTPTVVKPPTTAATTNAPTPTSVQAEKAQRQAASTNGHLEDIRLGWRYVQQNFWTGVGPKSPQLPGLAAKGTARVYVHNELLQVWLRYGIAAPLLLAFFFLSAALMALRTLWDARSDVVARTAAAFLLITPIVLMTAAFLTDTSRWPLLVGIAAGIVLWRLPGGAPQASPSSLTDTQPN